MAAVELRGLTKRYGRLAVVDRVDLAVEHGSLVCLLGPSGCGKTTTLRLIAGFLEPDEGDIHVGAGRLSAPGAVVPPERRNMSMIFQSYALWPHMTIAENVGYGLAVRRLGKGEIAKRVSEILAVTQMARYADRYPAELSGGQQQRVALARALVLNPDILLLDEPLSNLDAKIRVQVRAEIRKLQKDLGITTVYVTHDQEEALSLSDRVAVMRDGRVLQVAPPKELYERPAGRFVADFVGTNNFLPGTCRDVAADRICAETALGLVARRRRGSAPASPACSRYAPRTSRWAPRPRTRSRAGSSWPHTSAARFAMTSRCATASCSRSTSATRGTTKCCR